MNVMAAKYVIELQNKNIVTCVSDMNNLRDILQSLLLLLCFY